MHKYAQTAFRTATVGLLALLLAGCPKNPFDKKEEGDATGAQDPAPTPPVQSCTPEEQISVPGLTAQVAQLVQPPNAKEMPKPTGVAHFFELATMQNTTASLDEVYVPTRMSEDGFPTSDGAVVNDEGDVLTEYFGLATEGRIKLGPEDEPGDYQFAVISDDGAILTLDGHGAVDNDGNHAVKMACNPDFAVAFDANTRVDFNLAYYQGKPQRIALIVLWRKSAADESKAHLKYCGKAGANLFFTAAGGGISEPTKTWIKLLELGWKPLTADNYDHIKTTPGDCPGD